MTRKQSLGEIYDTARDVFYLSEEIPPSSPDAPKHHCRCGRELRILYLESMIYMVTCPGCKDVVHLVRATSREAAMKKVERKEKWL